MINNTKATYSGTSAHEYARIVLVATTDTFNNLSCLLSRIVSLLARA